MFGFGRSGITRRGLRLHRLDLTKDQRDEHIRRYGELLEQQRSIRQPRQNDAPVLAHGRRAGPQHEKEVASQIAMETGLSKRTIERALSLKPTNVVMVREAETDEEAILREASAIVAAWNRARQAARDLG